MIYQALYTQMELEIQITIKETIHSEQLNSLV